MIGRAFVYALAAEGEAGVTNLLDLFEKEMQVAMTLTSSASIKDINHECLLDFLKSSNS